MHLLLKPSVDAGEWKKEEKVAFFFLQK